MLPVNDSNNAQFHRNDPAHQYIHSICTSIHQIQLGDHCQSSPALGIKHAWLKKKKKNTPGDITCRKFKRSHLPSGSTSRATLSASEVAMSVFAAVTAKMMEFGLEMNLKISSLIWISMSLGWSPTGTCLGNIHTDFNLISRRTSKMEEDADAAF